MVDLAKLRAELDGLAPGVKRCKKHIEVAEYNGYASYSYYACQLADNHPGECSLYGRNVLLWPGYDVMRALLDELEEHRESAMLRRAVLAIPEVYVGVVSQAVADELELAKEWARSYAEESRALRVELEELKKRLGD
jgi:hypothetical protein